MDTLSVDRHELGLTLIVGWPHQATILEVIARLALNGPLRIIVGGNRFDAQQLSRLIRRHTTQLDPVLERVQLARPFTCYQVITLLEETELHTPLIFLDMLTTFYDDNISEQESARLVVKTTEYLCRFKQQAPVLVTLRIPPVSERHGLAGIVRGVADRAIVYTPPAAPRQPALIPATDPKIIV